VEIAVLALFSAALIACVLTKLSILYALGFGLLLFLTYGKLRHSSWRQLGSMVLSGIKTVRGILTVFMLIGVLTALWRMSGTIPVIISLAMNLVQPHLMILLTFLLNCIMSVLTGTAFGTAATMGVICMTMANSMGINPVLVGGAILSGVYFGDRCSPISTSALLVSQLTHTHLFTNIRNMLRTAALPFTLTCAIYGAFGMLLAARNGSVDVTAIFSREFDMRWFMVAPAVLMLVLAVMRVNVKIAMGASIVLAAGFAYFFQGVDVLSMGRGIVFGYAARTGEVAGLLNGGGVVSMLNVAAIVCLSSAYAGIFAGTDLLGSVKKAIVRMEGVVGSFAGMLVTSVVAGMISCNQTLDIMMTDQLCDAGVDDVSATEEKERERKALNLEDTAVVVCPLIPWSIAGAVPLSSVGGPELSVIAACFLYLLPLCRLLFIGVRKVRALRAQHRARRNSVTAYRNFAA
jgi:NhaC family Na+:H+ antiporter